MESGSQAMLGLWVSDDPERLRRLAEDIEAHDGWQGYLSIGEHLIFKSALESSNRDLWPKLLRGDVKARVESKDVLSSSSAPSASMTGATQSPTPGNTGTPVPSAPAPAPVTTTTVTSIDPIALAFRVRYMLYDKSFAILFPSVDPEASLDIGSSVFESPTDGPNGNNKQEATRPPARTTDDDYDFDEDDEDEKKEEANEKAEGKQGNGTVDSGTNDTQDSPMDGIINDDTINVSVEPSDELEAKTTSRAVIAYNKLYHLFENDREIALKQRKLEESDRQMDSDLGQLDASAASSSTKSNDKGSASFGAANLSLKHLLATIEAKKDMLSLTDVELRNLILDVRKNRSKWASEDKIGQEELYEAAEKVVMELRGYTEHSTAFLNKVNKRDAPNYFTIIKHPMDLNTVMKKLKSFQYKSKKEFVSDLMLIWKNCLTYNADPKHFLRGHAIEMQKKTLSLIPLIPDITVRDRAEVEAEEAAAAAAASGGNLQSQEEDEGARGGKHAAKGRKRKVGETEEHTEEQQRGQTPDSKKPATAGQSVPPTSAAAAVGVGTPTPARASPALASVAAVAAGANNTPTPGPDLETELKETLEEESREQQEDAADLDVEQKVWQTVYTKPRSLYCVRRADIFRNDKIQPDAPAPMRTSESMGRFSEALSQVYKRHKDEEPLIARRFRANGGGAGLMDALDKDDDKAKFIIEYEASSGLPVVPWAVSAENERDDLPPNLQIQDIKTSGYVLKPGGLGEKINKNLAEMQQIRKICSKIELIRQMQQDSYVPNASNSDAYNPPQLTDEDLDLESRLPNRDQFDEEASAAAMSRAVGRIAMHSGFESTQITAVETLSEIAASYLTKLAKSFKEYLEKPDRADMTQENLVLAALRQHGISGVGPLETYVHDDIERHGVKLQELKRKLTTFMGELLRPATDQEFSDRQFSDNSEQFLNGDFSQMLGDDFFGFRELGLDKELGLLTESVPFHLLRRRLQASAVTEDAIPEHVDRVLSVPEYPPMDRTVAARQIGLLQAFFASKLDAHNGKALTEVEQLPQKQRLNRAKLAPTGKIMGTRKKPLSRAFIRPPPVVEPDSAEEEKAIDDGIDKALMEFDDAFM